MTESTVTHSLWHENSGSSRYYFLAGLLLSVLFFFTSAFGQSTTGSLNGTVYDVTGAILPNAQVVMKNEATGTTRQTTTNGSGYFGISAVMPGTYTVTVTATGFNNWQQTGVVFNANDNRTLSNITLQVSGTAEQVAVVSDAGNLAPVDTGESSNTLNTQMITQLSIQGRNAAELIKIMPGMGINNGLNQGQYSSLTVGTNSGPVGSYSANGTQPYGAMTMISDGANLVDPGNQGTQIANVNQDMTQELKVMTSAFGAEYAKGPVTFQAISKGGSAAFHGEGYLYARHSIFNSEDSYQKNQGVPKPEDRYYYPGGNIGGPVLLPWTKFNRNRDKLFFWAGYEYMNQHPAGILHSYFVPTPEMLSGNFSQSYLSTLPASVGSSYGALTQVPCPTPAPGGTVSAGCQGLNIVNGQIPTSLMDPNGLALAKLYPAPNVDPATHNGNNYQFLENSPQNRWEARGRIDYSITDNTKLFVSYTRQNETDYHPITVWWAPSTSLPYPSPIIAPTTSDTASANLTHVFSPSLTSETIFTYARYLNPNTFQNPTAAQRSNIGFDVKGIFGNNSGTAQIPNFISWGGLPGFYLEPFGGNWQGGAFGALKQAPSVSENVSKVAGTHTMKFGFYWDFSGNLSVSTNTTQGQFEFENWGGSSTGNAVADLLLGHAQSYTETSAAPIYNFRYYQYAFYGQDSWKVTRRLTLNYGIRFDHLGQWVDSNGLGSAVWNQAAYNNSPSALGTLTGLQWHDQNKDIPLSGFKSPLFYYNPRFGLAYDVFGNGKTVLRGGYGVYRYQLSNNDVQSAADPPRGIETVTLYNLTSLAQVDTTSPSSNPTAGSIYALQQGSGRVPRTESYNFTISQALPFGSLGELSYQGNQSQNLLIAGTLSNINNVPFGALLGPDPVTGQINDPNTANLQDYRPFQNYQGINVIRHGSYSNYNALQATWQKQRGPWTLMLNYTFGKVMGIRDGQTNNGGGNGALVDPFNMNANYGVLAYDHTHIFNAAYVINLPSPIHGNAIARGAINGWELSGITQLQSGAPIQPNTGGNLNVQWAGGVSNRAYLGTDAVVLVPKLTCDPRSNLQSGQYFNPGCFTAPPVGQNGDVIWPYIKGPAYFNSDLALFKNFRITEHKNVQFRFSAFNFLNHPLMQFNAPATNQDVRLSFIGAGNTPSTTNTNTLTTGYPQFSVGRRVIEMAIKFNF